MRKGIKTGRTVLMAGVVLLGVGLGLVSAASENMAAVQTDFARTFISSGQDDYGAPRVLTSREDSRWTIRGSRLTVKFDLADLRLSVQAGSRDWRFLPSFAGDLTVKSATAVFTLRLADATVKNVESYATGFRSGIKITLSGFIAPPASPTSPPSPLDLTVQLFLGFEGRDEDLVVRIIASDGTVRAREILFPPSLDPASFDATVVPFMQGMLLPKDWPRPVRLYDEISYGRGLYMPWWGHEQGDSAVLVLLETPADAGIRFVHPAGGPTRADVRWLHSLGRWSYPRSVRYAFIDHGNYVALTKRYRRYSIEFGNFVSLREKIARNPLVAELVGSPVIHTSILYHIQPDSSYYKKDDPKANHQLVTFDERAADLRRLAARGVRRAYVHLDGWGFRGYDNLHPDILPPSPEAGGWEGRWPVPGARPWGRPVAHARARCLLSVSVARSVQRRPGPDCRSLRGRTSGRCPCARCSQVSCRTRRAAWSPTRRGRRRTRRARRRPRDCVPSCAQSPLRPGRPSAAVPVARWRRGAARRRIGGRGRRQALPRHVPRRD